MERIAKPGGLFALFRIVQYIPYIAIGLLIIMIVFWVIFGIKKFKWAKTLAITLTVLVVITSLLSFYPYLIGSIIGKRNPMKRFFGSKDYPAGGKEQFRDYRDRQEDKQEKKKSGLDIDICRPSVDFANEVVVI